MAGYEIVDVSELFKWGRINGTFYCNRIYLKEFLIKYEQYKREQAA